MHTTVSTEALAERYATLKHQIKLLDQQLKVVTEELLTVMTPGGAVTTPEYRLACNPGRATFTWLCSKEEKKALENHLIEKGVADYKVGQPYIVLRFLKQADLSE